MHWGNSCAPPVLTRNNMSPFCPQSVLMCFTHSQYKGPLFP